MQDVFIRVEERIPSTEKLVFVEAMLTVEAIDDFPDFNLCETVKRLRAEVAAKVAEEIKP